ncbi:uncharacterized protein LOC128558039 [Mercenaria mercenaria]|uniref:uncharacterized protein LOC128558039 n=1 Tax=Mercenaria mercenaria TaxID=6596 RepID=UPI00234E46CA|nr:uncharacterized protein LOC128558039 [Mercenaria mercenaria]
MPTCSQGEHSLDDVAAVLYGAYPYKWYNIAVWIHDLPYQFQSFGGQLCWEIEDLLDVCVIEMRCVQPLAGYYVTVQAYATAQLEYIQPPDTEASFQEIEVYGEATECGQYFGMALGKLARFQVDYIGKRRTTLFQLDHPTGKRFFDGQVIDIDLLAVTGVEGMAFGFSADRSITVEVKHDRHKISETSKQEELVLKSLTLIEGKTNTII